MNVQMKLISIKVCTRTRFEIEIKDIYFWNGIVFHYKLTQGNQSLMQFTLLFLYSMCRY